MQGTSQYCDYFHTLTVVNVSVNNYQIPRKENEIPIKPECNSILDSGFSSDGFLKGSTSIF